MNSIDTYREIARLRDELAVAKHTIREMMGKNIVIPIMERFGLTQQEAQFLAALLRRDMLSKESAMIALYGELEYEGGLYYNILSVIVCRIRKKIKPYNLKLKSIYGIGWILESETKYRINALLSQ